MPLYDYRCRSCGHEFTHFWRSLRAAQDSPAPACPACGHAQTERVVSQVAVLGQLGGLTPSEQNAKRAREEKLSSITPREQIQKFQAAKKKP